MSLGVIADWASVISLALVAFNVHQVTRIKKQIILNLTLDRLLRNLQDDSKAMNSHLLFYEASVDSFNEVVGKCDANVGAVRRRFGIHGGWFCRRLQKSIARYRSERNVETARTVYNDLQQVIREIINRIDERRIRGS
jgi:hypothetical protein